MPLSLRVHPSRGLWTLVALLLGLLFLTMETYRDLRPSPPAPSLSAAERQEASHKRFLALRMAQQAARLPGLAATEGGLGRLIPADISGLAFEPPLDAIRGELAAGFAWADMAGQADLPAFDPDNGVALLAPPAEWYGGLRPLPFSYNSFLAGFAEMLDHAWGGRCGASAASPWDDAMRSSHVCVRPEFIRPQSSGPKRVVQGVGVALVGDAPVFLLARRTGEGDPRADLALAEEELTRLAAALSATPPLLLLELRDQAARSLRDPLVWLPALAVGWLYALESGFVLLSGVWIGAAATLLSVLIGFFFGRVFPGNPLPLVCAAHMSAGAAYALLAARLRKRFRPAGLDEALAAQEQALIEELRVNQEQVGHPSAYEDKVRRLAEDRAERAFWHGRQAALFFACALLAAWQFQEYRSLTTYDAATARAVSRLSATARPEPLPSGTKGSLKTD